MSFITNTDPEKLYGVQAFDWHLCGVRLCLQHHEQVSWTPTFSVFLCLKFCVQYKAIHKQPTACAVRRDVAAGRGPQGCRTFPCSIPECSLFLPENTGTSSQEWRNSFFPTGKVLLHGSGTCERLASAASFLYERWGPGSVVHSFKYRRASSL